MAYKLKKFIKIDKTKLNQLCHALHFQINPGYYRWNDAKPGSRCKNNFCFKRRKSTPEVLKIVVTSA